MQRFQDQVVLITGASRGLGEALAQAFAGEGAKLAICSRQSSADDLRSVQQKIEALGAECLSVIADISQRRDVERLIAEVFSRYGHLDILINNASALGPTPMPYLADYPIDDFEQVLRANLTGPFMLIRAAIGDMLARNKGVIINVSSDAGVVGYPTWGAYGVSKAGLDHLTRTWAAETEGTGVRVLSIDPGSMNTVMHRDAEPEEDPTQWADPASITNVFLYLASDASQESGTRYEAQNFAIPNPITPGGA